MSGEAETRVQRAYYVGYVCVLLGCFTPSKALGYMLPALLTMWLLWERAVSRNRLALVVGVVTAVALFYWFVGVDFLWLNYLVAVVTYSSIVPVLVVDGRMLASKDLLRRMLVASSYMIAVQGVIGCIQAAYGALQGGTFGGANGDHVTGTIYPHLTAEHAFSNPMFAVNMSLMLVAGLALPQIFGGRRRWILAVGALSLVLASVVHVLVFLVGAGLCAIMLVRARPGARGPSTGRLLALVALVAALSYAALPGNVAGISQVAEKAFDLDAVDIPRAYLLSRVITELPEDRPSQPYLGVGPGQFCSRASLIMSGQYLGGPDNPKALPMVAPQTTPLAYDYCISLLIAFSSAEADVGSSQQPFFSWLSVYTETGLLGSLLVVLALVQLVREIRRRAQEDASRKFPALLLMTGCLFLILIGWQMNYWEAPQAIFVGLLLLKVLHANVLYAPSWA